MKAAHALQDAVKVEQADIGKLELPNWDKQGVETVAGGDQRARRHGHGHLQIFSVRKTSSIPSTTCWALRSDGVGCQQEAAIYVNVVPEKNDGKTAYTLTVKDVPVDGFWSVTLYDEEGWMPVNEYNIYSYNNVTAKKGADGSITIHFGGDPKADNYLPIMEGWNYIVRLYQPKKEILDGSWTFPSPKAVE